MILLRSRSLGLSGAVSPSIIGHEAEWAFRRDIPRYLVEKITIPGIKNQNFRDFALWIFSGFSRDFGIFGIFEPRSRSPGIREFRDFSIWLETNWGSRKIPSRSQLWTRSIALWQKWFCTKILKHAIMQKKSDQAIKWLIEVIVYSRIISFLFLKN